MTTNKELILAREYVDNTDCNIFLTGKAGTGKTTFLQGIKKSSSKRMIVVAPTGVAAINAGGVTMHSFFQLPFGPFVPGTEAYNKPYRFSKAKTNIIKSLDLLVIDEISMVRADMLDAIDKVLKFYRRNQQPFGGVQLLMIGDLYQLSPVVKDSEKPLLDAHYKSYFFFGSQSLQQKETVYIELKHIYRQTDENFINILNQVRDNSLNKQQLDNLNNRYDKDVLENIPDNNICLCSHNWRADNINETKLQQISSSTYNFTATIDKEFPEHAYPTSLELELKKGAQVMFLRNDPSEDKKFFNGKIGKIIDISSTNIKVLCPEDLEPIVVEPAIWDHLEFKLDSDGEIEENKIGSFSQYPLKLAWAITIHKSQGLTFNQAIIDAEAAFAPGQVYVALSRCRNLEGLTLGTKIKTASLGTDTQVSSYITYTKEQFNPETNLDIFKRKFQEKLILQCFHFGQFAKLAKRFAYLLKGNKFLLTTSPIPEYDEFIGKAESEIFNIGGNFQRQLTTMFDSSLVQANQEVQIRCQKASQYFLEKIDLLIASHINEFSFDCDNKETKKQVNKALKNLLVECRVKQAAIKSCAETFTPEKYLRAISQAEIRDYASKKTKSNTTKISYSQSDISYPELFEQLREWRNAKAKSSNLAPFQVMHQKVLVQITASLPTSISQLVMLKGIGPKLTDKYGDEIIEIVSSYIKKNNITDIPIIPKPQPTTPKIVEKNTKQISLELHQKGLSIADIAKERELALSTIEGHLAHWVTLGDISISELDLEQVKEPIISQLLDGGKSFSDIRDDPKIECSYGQIKLVKAHLDWLDTQKPDKDK